jgi:hypothetical protein
MKDNGELSPQRKALRQRIASLSGKVGAARRQSKPGYSGLEATRPATEAFWTKRMDRVDPNHALMPDERMRLAKKLWQAEMNLAKLQRAQAELRKAD